MQGQCTWAKKVDKVIFKFMWAVSVLAGISLFIIAILCTVDALGGKILSKSVPNGTEMVTFLNIPVVFFAIGFIQVERGHTTVDLFSAKMPKVVQTVIHVAGELLGAVVCGFLSYCAVQMMIDKFGSSAKASSAANAFLVWPFALVIVIGFFLITVAFIWSIFREFLIPPQERMGAMPAPPQGDVSSDINHMARDIENLKTVNGQGIKEDMDGIGKGGRKS